MERAEGQRFGRLTLVRPEGGTRKHPKWRMRCDCGNEKAIDLSAVVSGRQVACGCYRLERVARAKRLDLTGRRVGMLAVRNFYASVGAATYWMCECDCGCGYIGLGTHLSRSRVQSCGCIRRALEQAEKTPRQLRKYAQNHARRAIERGASGRHSAADIERIYIRQRGLCASCSQSLRDGFHRDHRVPLARGGSNDASNIDLLCPRCNMRKHAKDPIAWANENGRLL